MLANDVILAQLEESKRSNSDLNNVAQNKDRGYLFR